jgi:hypothetical protein
VLDYSILRQNFDGLRRVYREARNMREANRIIAVILLAQGGVWRMARPPC